ncbi:MAG: AMP-binding protein, partial [Anaerolineales bacterium]|nr:AMP-binding protein [Anaerolineales bacterium]
MNKPETIPQHFLQLVQKYGSNQVALRQKELGIWREYSWQESYEIVRDFALGMMTLGLQRGDNVATMGDNDRHYLWAYIALQAVGAVQVGIFTDAGPNEVAYAASYSDAAFVLAKDQEQCDKFLEIRAQIPNVKQVIYWEDRGLWDYNEPWLMSYEEVLARGRALAEQEPSRFETEVAIGRGADRAVMCFTSGTTGLPKAAVITHDALLASSEYLDDIDPRYDTDNHVSLLPLGWIAEHVLGVAAHVTNGVIMNFPEAPETVRENVREIAPEGILYNSRLWDNLVSTVQVRMNEATWINRKLYDTFLPIGYKVADKKMRNEPIGSGLRLQYALGDLLLFAPLRDKMGMSKIRSAYTAGSALSPDAMRFFHALGVNLKQIYGSTEVAGGVAMHRDGDIKFASVGKPVPGAEVRISPDGEIQIRSMATFSEYYKNPDATAEAFVVDADGSRWFKTGDAGYIDDDGHIIYLDRLKDMITLANGEKYSPQFIEGRLKFNPYIQDVMAIGGETR